MASPSNTASSSPRVAVIGAGMSGILAAIKLREAGYRDIAIFEKADRLGGTWRDNTYPGLSCDIPSHAYSYSFALNPDWTRHFSPGAEIQSYFEHVARQYEVTSLIRFNSEIERADWRDGQWHLRTKDGFEDRADFVICATGVLHHPVYPDIAGLKDFAGPSFHTARWDHSVKLDGKRVGIIGAGSTAIQVVPAIVDRVAKLFLFQRTAQWILPLPNPAYAENEKAMYRERPEVLRQTYDFLSQRLVDTFARAVIGDQDQLKMIEEACRANLEQRVLDPELRRRLTPNYRAACKRLIMSDDFYPAIQKPNAELVTEAIERIEPTGVQLKDGRLVELDVLVLATGFDGHAFMRPMQVTGQGGKSLSQAWAESTAAYRSVALPDFPNFFMMVGPNSPIGNFSVIRISELQIGYIIKLMAAARRGNHRAIVPKQQATQEFNRALREAMAGTVWVSGCKSWYLDKHGNPALWPWSFDRFRDEMQAPRLDDFDLVA
jgi:cation diffusion facilitator CzcD-associated flavoprotein CzcO